MGADLSKKKVSTLARDSHFSKEEVKQWHSSFRRSTRASPSGNLEKEQFKEVFEELFSNTCFKTCPDGNIDAFCSHIFRVCDKDNNDQVDFEEFLSVLDITCSGSAKAKLEWLFNLYDVDGNGLIDQSEMETLIKAIFEMKGKDVKDSRSKAKKIFKKMDANRDNVISKEEFQKTCISDKKTYKLLANQASVDSP